MTTAQDQQSRAEFEAIYRSDAFQAGIPYGSSKEVAYAVWQAARALPQGMEPVGYMIDWPDEPELGHYFAEKANDGARSQALHIAAQVQAMGRVPPGWQMVPVEPTSKQVVLMAGAILHQQHGTADTLHPCWPQAVEQAEKAYRAAIDFAPRPPAAQEARDAR